MQGPNPESAAVLQKPPGTFKKTSKESPFFEAIPLHGPTGPYFYFRLTDGGLIEAVITSL